MRRYHRRILCGYLLTFAFGSCLVLGQEESGLKITPNQSNQTTQTATPDPSTPRATFEPAPVAPASASPAGVSRLLAGVPNYKSGDLLTWEMVKPTLDRLRRSRVPLPPERELRAKFLIQNDPLVRMLGSERGKEFFNELTKKPSAIDVVDRYRSLPRGERFLSTIIDGKDGHKFFTEPYWLTQRDAQISAQLGLARVPNGDKFGEPTGRIYVESQLVAFLAEYRASRASRSYE